MANELKPCPFCGKTNISVGYDSGLAEVMRPAYFAVCRDCGARGPHRPTDDGAIAAWNRVGVAESATTTGGAKMREVRQVVGNAIKAAKLQDSKCSRCRDDGLEPGEECPYYGEPNGCNAPISGEYPKSSHLSMNLDALTWLRDYLDASATTTADEPEDATVEGIVRNILGYAESAKCHTEDAHVLGYIDQIEQWARALTMGVVESATTTPLLPKNGDSVNKPTAVDTGVNNAKMREALESISSILKGFDFDNQNAPTPDDLNCVHNAIGIAESALAAPARNCDRYTTVDDARKAHEEICERYSKCHLGCPLNNKEHYSAFDCFEAWLYAPYLESEAAK